MLTHLTIRNFAIIHAVDIDFSDGMTVLCGETGAGKSIIIDAIELLCGGRGSAEYVQHGFDKCMIEGLFYPSKNSSVWQLLTDYDIDAEENSIILARSISSDGKSVCRINGKMMPVTVARLIGNELVDIHSQHENQFLLESKNYIPILDRLAGLGTQLNDYKSAYNHYLEAKQTYDAFIENSDDVSQLDYFQFQLEQLQNANIKENEIEELEIQLRRLQQSDKLIQQLHVAHDALQNDGGALTGIYQARRALEQISNIDEAYSNWFSKLESVYYDLEDSAAELEAELEKFEQSGAELVQVEERLSDLYTLQRKVGNDLFAAQHDLSQKVQQLLDFDSYKAELEQQVELAKKEAYACGEVLSTARMSVAKNLEAEVMAQLTDLYMPNVTFEIAISNGELQTNGIDKVEFLIATNKGELLKPIAKVASGGELSRIMLALKVIFTKYTSIDTIIFDEIDTGVSGKVAESIARKMHILGEQMQVLAITHLPQVVAMSDNQIHVSKTTTENGVLVATKILNDSQKENEVAQMLSGTHVTEAAMDNARALISHMKQ
ncbi:DNA repair protein RecN [Culicoidibacter larvae]|nr:DNA repair protein RecN [Culicoidibacter larvae]